MLEALAAAVEGSAFGEVARGSALAYPIANIVHLFGLVMLVGGIGLFDLRLAGAFRGLPVAALSRALTPIAVVGVALLVLGGLVMFAADAPALVKSDVFGLKLALIAVALANAAAFRLLWRHRLADWEDDPPALGRAMAVASVLLWLAVMILGRLIAYA